MEVTVQTAADRDLAFVRNLVPYYIYDMSEYMGWGPNREGRYDGCDDLADYWQKADHHPYLIMADDKAVGFAMVRPYPEDPTHLEIGEFFVLRKFRGCGIGRQSACLLFDAHPGKWLVRVLDGNAGALGFWQAVIHDYSGGHVAQTAETYECPHSGSWPMQFFRFESRSQRARPAADEDTAARE